MHTGLKRFTYLLLSAYLLASSIPAYADIAAGRAGTLAKQKHGGKVINVKSSRQGERTIYRVKLLQKSGRIQSIPVDAKSGKVLK